jgi:hypothetical protein
MTSSHTRAPPPPLPGALASPIAILCLCSLAAALAVPVNGHPGDPRSPPPLARRARSKTQRQRPPRLGCCARSRPPHTHRPLSCPPQCAPYASPGIRPPCFLQPYHQNYLAKVRDPARRQNQIGWDAACYKSKHCQNDQTSKAATNPRFQAVIRAAGWHLCVWARLLKQNPRAARPVAPQHSLTQRFVRARTSPPLPCALAMAAGRALRAAPEPGKGLQRPHPVLRVKTLAFRWPPQTARCSPGRRPPAQPSLRGRLSVRWLSRFVFL